jgi:methionyl aminopeptidase
VIELKSAREIGLMRRAGHILAEVDGSLPASVKPACPPGDRRGRRGASSRQRRAAGVQGLSGFPATVCISINEEVVHGIPSAQRRVKEGDIVGLDLGCIVDGYYADCAFTLAIGDVPPGCRSCSTSPGRASSGHPECRPAGACPTSRTPSSRT